MAYLSPEGGFDDYDKEARRWIDRSSNWICQAVMNRMSMTMAKVIRNSCCVTRRLFPFHVSKVSFTPGYDLRGLDIDSLDFIDHIISPDTTKHSWPARMVYNHVHWYCASMKTF